MLDRDERIRRKAYHLWVEEGRPSGRDADHWERAREEIAREGSPEQRAPPAVQTEPVVTAAKPKAAPRKAGAGRAPARPRKAKGG